MLNYIAPLISSIGTGVLASLITWWYIKSERQIKYSQITREQYILVLQNILSVISYIDLLIANRQMMGLYKPFVDKYLKDPEALDILTSGDSFKDLNKEYFSIIQNIRDIMLSIDHSGILVKEIEEILLELDSYIDNVAKVVVSKRYSDVGRTNFHKKYKREIKLNLGILIKSKKFDINKFKWQKV